jgi:WD40 repeat protein
MLVSASRDETVVLWDLATRHAVGVPLNTPGGVQHVAFSPDGQRILAATYGGGIRTWPSQAKPDDLCAKLATNMSHKQWNEWVSPDIDYIKVCPELPVAAD